MPRRGDEAVQTAEWAYGVLSTLPALADALGVPVEALPDRVWTDVAPREAAHPLVVISVGDPLDTLALGPLDRLSSTVPLNVRVIVEGYAVDPAAAPVRAIYARLHAAEDEGVAEDGRVLTCTRTGGVAYPETTEGVQYRHLGHTFQVVIE